MERRRVALSKTCPPPIKDSRNAVNCLETATPRLHRLVKRLCPTKQLSILRPPLPWKMYCFRPGRDSSASVHSLPPPPLGIRLMGSRNENSSFAEEINSPVDRVVSTRSFERIGCRGLMKKMGREVNGCGQDVS